MHSYALQNSDASSPVRRYVFWNGDRNLAVVLDLFSRKVVGWSLGRSLETTLVAEALRQAIEARRPVGQELLHHSDRGSQYTSDAYRQTLNTLGIECSMSRSGDC
jgi:putative transposase